MIKKKSHSLIFDAFCILSASFFYLNFIDLTKLIQVTFFNYFYIIIFLLLKFYKKSSILKIFEKLKIIFLTSLILSIGKFYFFEERFDECMMNRIIANVGIVTQPSHAVHSSAIHHRSPLWN